VDLDTAWVEDVRVNRSAAERRAATVLTRRTVKKQWQAAWLLRAVECIDLTTLSGDDTPGNVHRLCIKAKQPIERGLLHNIGFPPVRVGAVCVYHRYVRECAKTLEGSGIPVAAVSTGFPAGLAPLNTRLAEVKASVEDGAKEIDVVITRAFVLRQEWNALFDEVKAFREACGEAHMKVILGTGDLGTFNEVARASRVCMMAGADFIKTSTGKEVANATLPVSLVMLRAIRDYHVLTGYQIGYKPAGGIRTAAQALGYCLLIVEELGVNWFHPNLFRLGASTLLSDIERQLEHFATGRYSASYRHSMG
jgi:deoxyribose-phosphate aldolase